MKITLMRTTILMQLTENSQASFKTWIPQKVSIQRNPKNTLKKILKSSGFLKAIK